MTNDRSMKAELGGTVIRELNLNETPRGTIGRYWLHIVHNKLGEPIRVPILVARGGRDGAVLGLTAAVHGNELNGIPVIQSVFRDIDVDALAGTVVGVLVVNVPGLLLERREFSDGADLNRIAPGKAHGNVSQVYIHRVIELIVGCFDFHIDLHTASFGRLNSHYVRADMEDERTARLAKLQNPQIIVHNAANDKTLRGAADAMGIPSVTVELCDPHVFQKNVITSSLIGIRNVLHDLGMLEGGISCPLKETILCARSDWMFTDEGGILTVLPTVTDRVGPGDPIAHVHSIFGDPIRTYRAPADAIVIGRSINPLNQTGSRIVHLGHEPRAIPCVTAEA